MSAQEPPDNVHATAIVVGTSGLLFTGPPGSGKSARAFACLDEAAARGLFATLVADDQVFVSVHGGAIVAAAPPPIAGLVELRGSGIVRVRHLSRAVMHLAVLVGGAGGGPRLPEPGERLPVGKAGSLPMVRLPGSGAGLAALAALCPQFLRM
ncbi:MAG TPA: serine/threonine protein kinase [Pararhizobium sp.]|nr:serine/threonine protein kinase [Pararhizobium sp.]